MAEWMRVGFVHGVMNTDNMSILGLTIDYGPYGWLEAYDPDWTPNITDASGRRYRFGHQPQVGQWNLAQLARALAPLCHGAEVEAAVAVAAEQAGLRRHLAEVVADVRHALATLRALGVGQAGRAYALEYPLAGLAVDGALQAGYADLVADLETGTVVIDFKTDPEPAVIPDLGAPGREGAYARQVGGYARALGLARPGQQVRGGLLYTSTGGVAWIC
jgi:ATP-dependent exoDNAse (exonuclease V) beta subunit